jgi:hypothetical protein
MFEHQLKVRLLPLFYKLQLVESTNSLVSLALTRRKHQLPECSSTDWMEAPTSTYTSTNLFESTNSLVSLAPTRRKHQLPECSSTDWMEAPTSTYTSTNLHIENSVFSQAPPCHPVFLATTRWKLQIPIFKHQLEYQRITVLPSTTLPPRL